MPDFHYFLSLARTFGIIIFEYEKVPDFPKTCCIKDATCQAEGLNEKSQFLGVDLAMPKSKPCSLGRPSLISRYVNPHTPDRFPLTRPLRRKLRISADSSLIKQK